MYNWSPEGEEVEEGPEHIPEELIAENFANWMKTMNPQTQEAQ